MNLGQILLAAALSFFSKSASVRVGAYTVTGADSGGAPVHLTASNLILAYENFTVAGGASVQSGSTVITVTKNS